jgi:hypothetical protein
MKSMYRDKFPVLGDAHFNGLQMVQGFLNS